MPLQAQQLITLCCQEAKVPSWTTQAGQKLNLILSELCAFDLDVIRATYQFNFNTALTSGSNPVSTQTLPANWLRANKNDVFYTILGVQYIMIPVSLAEFDAFVQQAGLAQYPEYYAVDNSPRGTGGSPVMFVWPPPSGAYPVTARYYAKQADIASPATSTAIPWFSYESELYLHRRLTGEMLLMANDDRAAMFLNGESKMGGGATFMGASAILKRYLQSKDDAQRIGTVTLDKRRFGTPFDKLRNTKTIGW